MRAKAFAGSPVASVIALVAVPLLTVAPLPVGAVTLAGSTEAQMSVSPAGSLQYRVPIKVPAGINGLQPKLAFAYDSNAGASTMGPGWSVEGLSAIKRCPRTARQDGVRGAITLTATDRFCLDGVRLTLEGTKTYGQDGAVYKTEIESFSRVTSYGAAGTGPMRFVVEYKNGTIAEYGGTADSRLIPGPAAPGGAQPTVVVQWAINSLKDRYGNEVKFNYLADAATGLQVISNINYNNDRAGVDFSYDDLTYPRILYIAGTRVTQSKNLTKVLVNSKSATGVSELSKSYSLSYEVSNFWKSGPTVSIPTRPIPAERADLRLNFITECGGNGDCLNPLKFEWTQHPFGAAAEMPIGSASSAPYSAAFSVRGGFGNDRQYPRRFADLNDDGILDIVGMGADGVYVLFSDATKPPAETYKSEPKKVLNRLGYAQGWQDGCTCLDIGRQFIDMNRDGYPDIVMTLYLRGAYVAYWDPVNKVYLPEVAIPGADALFSGDKYDSYAGGEKGAPTFLADMNDDGYPDFVAFRGGAVLVGFWDGSSVSAPVGAAGGLISTYEWLAPRFNSGGINISHRPIFLEDMNGDGLPDIVGIGKDGVVVYLWRPETKVFEYVAISGAMLAPQTASGANPLRVLADMNGDGYPDVVQLDGNGVTVMAWDGAAFRSPVVWANGGITDNGDVRPIRIMDMNQDGYPDIVVFKGDGIWVSLSNGVDRFATEPTLWKWSGAFPSASTDATGNGWGSFASTPRYIVDAYSGGGPEIFGFGSDHSAWLPGSRVPSRRVVRVTDSLGAATEVLYAVAQPFGGRYGSDAVKPTWPRRDGKGPYWVVSQVSTDNGVGGKRVSQYRYSGAKFDAYEGSLGFGSMVVRDEATGIEEAIDYLQGHPFTGREAKKEVRRSTVNPSGTVVCAFSSSGACETKFSTTPGSVIRRATNTHAKESLGTAAEFSGNSRWFVFQKQSFRELWELDRSALPSVTIDSYYEEPTLVPGSKQWGNLTKEVTSYGDAYKTSVVNTYDPANETTWALGRLSQSVVTRSTPARTIGTAIPSNQPKLPSEAGPLPLSPTVLSAILSLLLD